MINTDLTKKKKLLHFVKGFYNLQKHMSKFIAKQQKQKKKVEKFKISAQSMKIS